MQMFDINEIYHSDAMKKAIKQMQLNPTDENAKQTLAQHRTAIENELQTIKANRAGDQALECVLNELCDDSTQFEFNEIVKTIDVMRRHIESFQTEFDSSQLSQFNQSLQQQSQQLIAKMRRAAEHCQRRSAVALVQNAAVIRDKTIQCRVLFLVARTLSNNEADRLAAALTTFVSELRQIESVVVCVSLQSFINTTDSLQKWLSQQRNA